MKKELCAAVLLAALIVGAGLSVRHMDALAADMLTYLDRSEQFADSGDSARAEQELDKALDIWLHSDGYTHIFIRHPEIDSTSDAFYELKQALAENSEGLSSCYEKLRYHIISIDTMEQFRLGSIL